MKLVLLSKDKASNKSGCNVPSQEIRREDTSRQLVTLFAEVTISTLVRLAPSCDGCPVKNKKERVF
jgi:hypothetical protein